MYRTSLFYEYQRRLKVFKPIHVRQTETKLSHLEHVADKFPDRGRNYS